MKNFILDGKSLTIDQVYELANSKEEVKLSLSDEAKDKVELASNFVDEVSSKDSQTIYGINTGFGALANKKIPLDKLSTLQLNLIRSHCTGVGEPFDRIMTRAIMILRVNCLIQGHSGVKPETIDLIFKFIQHDILPIIPSQGSVGASGDLAPLAHMALSLIGEGDVVYKNQKITSLEVMKKLGLKPLNLKPKEGLALINGTTIMTALGVLAVYRVKKLIKLCDLAGAMTLDAMRGSIAAFDLDIANLKPHPGQIQVAQNVNNLLKDSKILNSHNDCHRVQDSYSLRCMPQVHGACRQTLKHAEEVISIEINSVTDNPLIFVDKNKVISGGNFHGEALALCMDYLSMGVSELSNILERRLEKMMNPSFSELPAFLTKDSGLNSGLMIAHVTVAALASENKTFCFPASVDSIPTSTDKEDHVSMGVTAGRKLHKIIENLESCIAIEFLCNTQALEFIDNVETSFVLKKVYNLIRKSVPKITQDRNFSIDIQNIKNLIKEDKILAEIENDILLN